jgi:hypothetical protein
LQTTALSDIQPIRKIGCMISTENALLGLPSNILVRMIRQEGLAGPGETPVVGSSIEISP